MYAFPDTRIPLPQVLLHHQGNRPHRRTHVRDFLLAAPEMERFNLLLARLDHTRAPLETDQLATAARNLEDGADDAAPAPCILQRLQLAGTVEQMLLDPDWEPATEAADEAREVVDYLHASWQLIPDTLPGIGQLDQAIVIDTAWPKLVREVDNFLDYQRLRRIEAIRQERDYAAVTFNRRLWLESREFEARLREHHNRVRESSYAPPSPSCFRVH